MKFELLIKEEAILEMTEAFLYYEEKSNGLGERFLDQVNDFLKKIQESSLSFQIKRNPYREVYIRKFPFVSFTN